VPSDGGSVGRAAGLDAAWAASGVARPSGAAVRVGAFAGGEAGVQAAASSTRTTRAVFTLSPCCATMWRMATGLYRRAATLSRTSGLVHGGRPIADGSRRGGAG